MQVKEADIRSQRARVVATEPEPVSGACDLVWEDEELSATVGEGAAAFSEADEAGSPGVAICAQLHWQTAIASPPEIIAMMLRR
jgi:hypothetical protein